MGILSWIIGRDLNNIPKQQDKYRLPECNLNIPMPPCKPPKEDVARIKYLDNYDMANWKPMKYAKEGDCCFDAYAAVSSYITLGTMKAGIHEPYPISVKIPLGFSIAVPNGYELQLRMRSGLSAKHGLICTNGVGTVDSGYIGEVMVLITNLGPKRYVIRRGDRICQCKIAIVPKIDLKIVADLDDTERGDGGFGHTGR